jgi:hypothetical protein
MRRSTLRLLATAMLFAAVVLSPLLASADSSFIGALNTVSLISSTVPPNGDINPYGIFAVPESHGALVKGNILVSNFNDSANLQGTGTTIVQITPTGGFSVFAQIDANSLPGSCPGGVGLTTALAVLREGWVIVGSLPTSDGTAATAKAGCLIVLDSNGKPVETFSGRPINGPWDMTVFEPGPRGGGDMGVGKGMAVLFFTNVLNGTVAAGGNVVNRGTVVRMLLRVSDNRMPRLVDQTVIGSGFPERTDPAALVIGPTGVDLGRNGTLYVADTLSNRVAAIPNALMRSGSAGKGRTVSENGALNGPLGLTIAPDGHIILANAGDGNLVEVTPAGTQVAVKLVEPVGAGSLFGLAIAPHGVYFVDDADNTLRLLH